MNTIVSCVQGKHAGHAEVHGRVRLHLAWGDPPTNETATFTEKA